MVSQPRLVAVPSGIAVCYYSNRALTPEHVREEIGFAGEQIVVVVLQSRGTLSISSMVEVDQSFECNHQTKSVHRFQMAHAEE